MIIFMLSMMLVMVNGMVGCTVKETKTEDDSKGKVEDVQESGKDADVPAEEDDSTVDVKNTQEPKAEDAANQQKVTQTIKPEEEPRTVKAEESGKNAAKTEQNENQQKSSRQGESQENEQSDSGVQPKYKLYAAEYHADEWYYGPWEEEDAERKEYEYCTVQISNVTDIQISGFGPTEGKIYSFNGVPGHEFS